MANKVITLPNRISVRALAALVEKQPTEVIGQLIKGGVMAHINQELDYDTAALLVEEFGFTAEPEVVASATITKSSQSSRASSRAPIVTIMGHVDHGKTSLLDYIRQANVAAGESGGITQHISAYQIQHTTNDKLQRAITFIDTPGHEAFSAVRSHGASITDLVVLVVAADDGMKPQTLEALKFARNAGVPIIVAINKVDLPGANIDRVQQQLVENNLSPEDWGGQTVVVPVSAKTGQGVNDLLEMIVLQTDLLELKADPDGQVEAIVIEANLDKQIGPVATVLVYNGTLRTGQVIVIGQTFGRIRAMSNDRGQAVSSAGPSLPVSITGLKDVPQFGQPVQVVPSEKVARAMTAGIDAQSRTSSGEGVTLPIILKADVGGSLAALQESIGKLKMNDATVDIINSGIGELNENDITRAKAAKGQVIVFRSKPNKRLLELAQKEAVPVMESWVIYEIIDYLNQELKKVASPTFVTTQLGRLKVLAVFSQKKGSAIVGGEVLDGELVAPSDVAVTRAKEEIGTAKATGFKIGKVEAPQVTKGEQCGVSLEESAVIEVGDVLVFSQTKQV